jgi:hypothetical protein
MIISPLKNAHKPPQVEAFQYGKLSDRQNTRGNSLSLVETEEGQFDLLEFPGQTQGRIVIFGTNTMTTTGADWPYTASDVLTISGCQITANNKTATVVSVSGKTMTFAASTFTPAVETQGSITDGTDVYQITVDPGHPQTLASQTSFDLTVSGKNRVNVSSYTLGYYNASGVWTDLSTTRTYNKIYVVGGATYSFSFASKTGSPTCRITEFSADGTFVRRTTYTSAGNITVLSNTKYLYISNDYTAGSIYFVDFQFESGSVATTYEPYTGITVTVPLQKTDLTQLELRGIVATYNADGSPASFSAQNRVFKDVDGKWKLTPDDKKLIFNGAENWQLSTVPTSGYTGFYFDTTELASANQDAAKLCSHFKSGTRAQWTDGTLAEFIENSEVNGVCTVGIRILSSRLTANTVEAFKTWLASNNVTLDLKVKPSSVIAIELSTADQTALNAAERSFPNITNIMLSTALGQVRVDQWSKAARR